MTWHLPRCCFMVSDLLVLKRVHIGYSTYCCTSMTIINTLSKNKKLLLVLPEFQHISFALKFAAHLVHHTKYKYNINSTMRAKIDTFHKQLPPESGTLWSTPLALIVPVYGEFWGRQKVAHHCDSSD